MTTLAPLLGPTPTGVQIFIVSFDWIFFGDHHMGLGLD